MIRTSLLLFVALLGVAASAAAQPGPAPGYDDPLLYAQDYATGQADEAAADPSEYAASKASQEAVVAEIGHAAYMACWTAHHHGEILPPGCEAFYEPPQEGAPLADDPEPTPVEEPAAEIDDAATEFASEVQDIVADIVEDPASAPAQLERLRDALFRFVDQVAGTIGGLGMDIVQAVLAIVGGIGLGLGAVGFGIGAAGESVLDGAVAGGDAVASTVQSAGQTVADAVKALESRVAQGVSHSGDFWSGAGRGVQEGAAAASAALSDAVASVRDAILGLFDGADSRLKGDSLDTPDVLGPADGILDSVTGLLP